MNERLCIKEVGVDLELCVLAHGHDVDPIIEASCNNNYFLDMKSSGIYVLIICNRGPDHIFSLIQFLGQVKVLAFCRSIRLPNLYFDLPRVLTSGISRTVLLPTSLHLVLLLTDLGFPPRVFISHSRTPVRELIPHSDSITLSNSCCLRV